MREDPSDSEPEDRIAAVLRTFWDEPMLWPVGIVVVLAFATFGAAIIVYAIVLKSLISGLALLLLIFISVYGLDADIRARRLRPASWLVLGLWAVSLAGAAVLSMIF